MPATLNRSRRRFVERATPATHANIDADAGIIFGVRVCGESSINGRKYPADTLRRARPKYEGARIFMNHDHSRDGHDRRIEDWVGVLQNCRMESNALFADIRLRKESPHKQAIIEAATSFNKSFGLSHVIDCSSYREGRSEVVEEILEVISVDFVCSPATNRGLFESVDVSASGVKPGGGLNDIGFDQLMQDALEVLDRLDTLHDATPANLRRLAAGRDASSSNEGMDDDGYPTGGAVHKIILSIDVEFAQKTLNTILQWYRDLPLNDGRKQSADAEATASQIAALSDRIDKAAEKTNALESRFRGDESAERIFEQRAKRLERRRQELGAIPAPMASGGSHKSPEQIFEERRRRLESLRR